MVIKEGAKIEGITAELSFGLGVARDAYLHFGLDIVVTEITGGKHMEGSLHYKGRAADLRLPSRLSAKAGIDLMVTAYLRSCLGSDWDVVLESDHVHIEFDPMRKMA